jgi:antitoxin component YwqK of YwqJK toxin-antitoxin module
MKITFFTIALLMISLISFSQVQIKDGKYFNSDGTLYSGVYTKHFPGGKTEATCTIVAGNPNGEAIFYFEDGTIQETGFYANGVKTGTWTQYNAQSKKVGEAFYKDGKKDGVWTIWDDNGVMRYHMVYSAGKKIDVWKMWDENANLVSEQLYN